MSFIVLFAVLLLCGCTQVKEEGFTCKNMTQTEIVDLLESLCGEGRACDIIDVRGRITIIINDTSRPGYQPMCEINVTSGESKVIWATGV